MICPPFNMRLSLDDDTRARTSGRRHREEGSRKTKATSRKKKNNIGAVVRVCQLRMIVGWLIFLPLCLLPDSLPRDADSIRLRLIQTLRSP